MAKSKHGNRTVRDEASKAEKFYGSRFDFQSRPGVLFNGLHKNL